MLALNKGQTAEFKFLFTVNGLVHNPQDNFFDVSSISSPVLGDIPIYTTSQNHGFVIGDKVSVSGVIPDSFNFCRRELVSVSNNTFSVHIEPSESYVSGGIASVDDIYITIIRGEYGDGPVVDGPFSYLSQNSENDNWSISIENSGEITFTYKISENLFPGKYYIQCRTSNNSSSIVLNSNFQIKDNSVSLNPVVISNNSTVVTNIKTSYENLNESKTSTILLIGHANGLGINNPIQIRSVQSAIDLLGGDVKNPLLRGVLNAYAAGARDIIICAAAPFSEYVENYLNRNTLTDVFSVLNNSVNVNTTFYERYYDRLQETYSIIKELDSIDIIVPLETSIIKTNNVDFISQLAACCADYHNLTGYVHLGVIGSHSGGLSHQDVVEIENNEVLTNKLTQYDFNNLITSDNGRFIIPVYGEAIFQHQQIKTSYTSSLAASFAGMMSSTPLNIGIIRSRIPGAMSVYGSSLTNADHQTLDNLGINTIYRGKKTRSTTPYEVYMSNEYTLSDNNSTLHKVSQMRLMSFVLGEINNYSYSAIGKFSYEDVTSKIKNLLLGLKNTKVIVDFSLNVQPDPKEKSKIIISISLISSFGLKKIDFSLSTGPGV